MIAELRVFRAACDVCGTGPEGDESLNYFPSAEDAIDVAEAAEWTWTGDTSLICPIEDDQHDAARDYRANQGGPVPTPVREETDS